MQTPKLHAKIHLFRERTCKNVQQNRSHETSRWNGKEVRAAVHHRQHGPSKIQEARIQSTQIAESPETILLERGERQSQTKSREEERRQVAQERRGPEGVNLHSGDELKMLCFGDSFADVEQDVEGRYQSHAEADVEGQLKAHVVSGFQLIELGF